MTQFKVGQTWRTREGGTAAITELDDSEWPISASVTALPSEQIFKALGKYHGASIDHGLDLVELIEDPSKILCGDCNGHGWRMRPGTCDDADSCDFCGGIGLAPRAYIAGPMTGLPGLNFHTFNAAAAEYRARGYVVENPVEINPDPTAEWADCMRADLTALVKCDVIVMLPGWDKSRGATLEHHVASALGLRVIFA